MRAIIAIAAMAALSGCSTFSSISPFKGSRPMAIGGGANSLKRTPCACIEMKQKKGLPEFLGAESGGATA